MSIEINVINEIVQIDETSEVVQINASGGIGVPSGGLTNQVLAKNSNTNYDFKWTDNSASVYWGQVSGTLSNQTDLQNALNLKVPTSRTLTINGTTQDLSADRTFTINTSPAGSNTQIQYNNSGAFGASAGLVYNDSTGAMTLSKNQNAATLLTISNTTSGTAARSILAFTNNQNVAVGQIFLTSATYTSFKSINAGDFAFYKYATGDIVFQTDEASSKIKFATGTSSTAQMTLTAAGRLLLGTTSESTFILDVNGTARLGSIKTGNFGAGDSIQFLNQDYSFSTVSNVLKINVGSGVNNKIDITNQGGNTAFRYFTGGVYSTFGMYQTDLFSNNQVGTAILELRSNAMGFLQPRMTTTQRDAIASPATGLSVYNTTTLANNTYNGTAWLPEVNLTAAGRLLLGTTTEGTEILKAIGSVIFGTNFYWDNTNLRLGIGTTTPTKTLDIVGDLGLTGTFNANQIGLPASGKLGVNANNSYFFNNAGAGVGGQNIQLGSAARCLGNHSIAINNAQAQAGGMALGYTRADSGDFVAASAIIFDGLVPISNVYFGSGKYLQNPDGSFNNGAGASYTINGSGANGTNFAGGNITIAGGKGTGSGASGDVIFSTATTTTSGTTLQTLTSRWWVKGSTGTLSNVASPNASAQVQVDSTTQGFLPPRMTTTQINAIATPAEGLQVYNTTINHMCFYMNGAWAKISHSPM